jgi:signal transduction histidine kinase
MLYEFMDRHHAEIMSVCTERLHQQIAVDPEIDSGIAVFFDEVRGALERELGRPDSRSPLPGKSEAAARLGAQPQRTGVDPSKVPLIYGALSAAIGEVGSRHALEIRADEYKVFNECIDAGVATSIEQYWGQDKEDQKQRASASIGYLAHELRTALGNASLAFKLLRTGEVGMNGRTAGVLSHSLTRMEALVARTLGEVQLDAGVKPTLRPVALAALLRRLQASFIPERAISLELQLDESLQLCADEMLLTSAVSNLISNAIKFSCAGAKIALRSRRDDDGVVIEVEDECGGLKTSDPQRLFRPFVKGTEPASGVGLGLSITKSAVEAMGGSVQVTDHPGKGCSFAMLFPQVEPSQNGAASPEL